MIGTNIHNVTSVTYGDTRVIGGTTVVRTMTIWSKGKKVYEIDLFSNDEVNLEIQPEGDEE
jgi:hypothetical protein